MSLTKATYSMILGAVTNVKDYGATGDGTTNDYNALVAAFAAVPAGSTIFFPDGTYNIGANVLTLPGKVITIVGTSNMWSGVSGSIITGSGTHTVRTLVYDGIASSSTFGRSTAIRNLTIFNTAVNGRGLQIDNGGLIVEDSLIECTAANGYGVYMVAQFGLSWRNVFASGKGTAFAMRPINATGPGPLFQSIDGAIANTFSNIFCGGQTVGKGVEILGLETAGAKHLIHGNTFITWDIENCSTGMDIDAQGNTFIDMHVEGNSGLCWYETDASANVWINPESGSVDAANPGITDFTTYISLNSQVYVTNVIANYTRNSIGQWFAVPFSAGNFTTNSAATWTVASGDVTEIKSTRIGRVMTLTYAIATTDVSAATASELRIAIPLGLQAYGETVNVGFAIDNGVRVPCVISATLPNTYIAISKLDGTNWSASAGATYVYGEITFKTN